MALRRLLQLFLTVGASNALHAQALFGTLVGNVTDQTGAALPSATVNLVNSGTAQKWDGATNGDGVFAFTTIPPGAYEIKVNATGFRAFAQSRITVQASATVRVDVRMEVGQLVESVEVNAAAAALQTDTMDVRSEIRAQDLQNTPVPVTRNYQNLLVTVPGISPPTNAHSISANPSRALVLNANGTNAQSTAVRVDGATTWNSWLPHLSGYVPTLEAIDQVTVQSNSYEADLGFAGGASVNVQIKSGTNQFHGSGFWYHNNQHLKARPYYFPASEPRQPKRILNQYGGSIGGPVVRNRLFFFAAYEATPDRSSAFRLAAVPTAAMRAGDLSASVLPVFDPLTGTVTGADRTPFPGNRLPAARMSPIVGKIVNLIPQPNIGPAGAIVQNYFTSGAFPYDRQTLDTKVNAQVSDRLNVAARVSYLNWSFDNPPLFGELGGTGLDGRGSYDGLGKGTTLSMTYSAVYTLSPSIVVDGYAGYTLLDNGVENIRLDENLGRDFLGIPGTNGASRVEGGWPGFSVAGFDAYGRAQTNSPWNLNLPQSQYVAGATVNRGKHSVRFGWDSLYVAQNGNEPFGSPGFFTFAQGVTGQVGTATNNYNSWAAFALGLPSNLQRTVRRETGRTRTWAQSLYFRDKWQPTRKLTVSTGLRWDYFAVPARGGGLGLEIFDFNTGILKMCGIGGQPTNCGFSASKRYFSPRLGIAYRASERFVVRAGYGITWDPVNIARNPLQSYPILSSATFPSANGFQFVSPIAQGIPAVAPPDSGNGSIRIPNNIALELTDPNFRRSYIQAWNLMLEREMGAGWTAQAGYAGNRSLRLQNRWNANYGFIGGGTPSLILNQRFGRVAGTNIFSDAGGFRGYYDSLQVSANRRMSGGYLLRLSYTWSKSQGPWSGNDFGVDGYNISTPDYWRIAAKSVKSYDRTHNFNAAFTAELPFGKGKPMAASGAAAALLGGWQFNGLYTAYTGAPFTVTSSGAALNAPGNSQLADQLKPSVAILGSPDRWFDTSAYAPVNVARFGNSGWNQLRGPGMHNVDLSIYRAFRVTEAVGVQFRAEMFNVSNTPHFANPNGDTNNNNFGRITGLANTGREGIDERFVRFGLRLSF